MTGTFADASPTVVVEVALPPAPYPGLRPYELSEWPIFFGRERIVADLRRRLIRQRLVMVHGSSGCGKSSVIRAGLLPRLVLEQARDGGPAWRTVVMRPGGSPLWHLAKAIAAVTDPPGEDQARQQYTLSIRRALNLGVEALPELAARFGLGRCGPICILLDQFEELFTYAREAVREEALTFVEVLRGFDVEPPPGIHAVLTMRSDHLGDCGRYLGFAELVNRTQYLVPRMGAADLLRAIREPARLFDGEVSMELAMRLYQDSTDEADALPLVQHCLMRLWQRAPTVDIDLSGMLEATASWTGQYGLSEAPDPFRPERAADKCAAPSQTLATALEEAPFRFQTPLSRKARLLDLPSYPGLHDSLSQHADEVLLSVGPQDLIVVERVFRALSDVDPQGRAIRRPRKLLELAAETEADAATLNRVIAPFQDPSTSFLTSTGDAALGEQDVVDIGHEALLRCWNRMNDPTFDRDQCPNGWLQREQEGARVWRVLKAQASVIGRFPAETLPASILAEYQRSSATVLGGRGWANRYGGGWDDVTRLVKKSRSVARSRKRLTFAILYFFAAPIFSILVSLILPYISDKFSFSLFILVNDFIQLYYSDIINLILLTICLAISIILLDSTYLICRRFFQRKSR